VADSEKEILKRVRRIEIKSRGLSNEIFAGQYHSAFRGRGMSFSEVREYRIGDDVRDIDWNVTARSSKPHIKIYEEERELTLMLLVDVSGSSFFGTTAQTKKGLQTEIAAVLAFSAAQTGDKVGAVLFSDRVEKFIPPKKGRAHILAIIRTLLEFTPQGETTSLAEPLRYLSNVLPKRSTAFVLSDFLFPPTEEQPLRDALKIATGKHDVVAVRIDDRREGEMPDVGIAEFRDAETGRKMWIDTSSKEVRRQYRAAHEARVASIGALLKHYKVDTAACHTGEDYVTELVKLFKKR
jgi:uncharacterized protein (DUF58 family)